MAFELSAPQRLGKTVVLGYCDIGAAGIRALHGLFAGSNENIDKTAGRGALKEIAREELRFSGIGTATFHGFPAFEAVHFASLGGEDDKDDAVAVPSLTLLKLNTEVAEDLSLSLAVAITDLLGEQGAALESVVVAAAVQPPKRHQIRRPAASSARPSVAPSIPLHAVCVFSPPSRGQEGGEGASAAVVDCPAVASLPELPSGACLADRFLTTFVSLCRLQGSPLVVLARLGYRATGAAAAVDGTDQAITELGQCLAGILGLGFDAKKACGARWSKGRKGAASVPSGVVPGYI